MRTLGMWLLRILLPAHFREHILDELEELYELHVRSDGQESADRWRQRQVWRLVLRALLSRRALRSTSANLPEDERLTVKRDPIGELRQDLRFAVRTLRRRPMFTGAALMALALGIGASTTVFSLVEATILQDLPYEAPGRLVSIWPERLTRSGQWRTTQMSPLEYLDVREGASSLQAVALVGNGSMTVRGLGHPFEVEAGEATASLAEVLGIRPLLGRWFLPGEDGPTGTYVTVLGHSLWVERFGSDPNVIGKSITLGPMGGRPYEVVGVVPPEFRWKRVLYGDGQRSLLTPKSDGEPPLWVPIGHNYGSSSFTQRLYSVWEMVARLRPDASLDRVVAEVEPLMEGDTPPERLRVRAAYRSEVEVAGLPSQLLLLAIPAALLLLIACGNVAALLLGEAVERRHEVATRVAIGAGPGRIARQLMTESVLLGILGSGIGAIVAYGSMRLLAAYAPVDSSVNGLHVNATVLLFTSGIGILAGLIFGAGPALTLSRRADRIAISAGRSVRSPLARRLVKGVLAFEIAMTVVLLVAGGLFTRTLGNLFAVDVGFQAENLIAIQTAIDRWPYPERALVNREIMNEMEAIPGVDRVSASWGMPLLRGFMSSAVEVEGATTLGGDDLPVVAWDIAMPGFHETMGIPMLAGRSIDDTDVPGAPPVVVISESTARLLWPHESALGQRIRFAQDSVWRTVVGISADVRYFGFYQAASSPVWGSYLQNPEARGIRLVLAVRTALDPRDAIPRLQEAARSVAPEILFNEAWPMATVLSQSATDERYRSLFLIIFGAAAVLLSAVGVFGVAARTVAHQTRELAIRMAIGAEARQLGALVLRGSLLVGSLGTIIGLTVAIGSSRLIDSFLFGIESRDPLTYLGAVGIVLSVCLAASYLPARRVLRLQPANVLKEE